MMAIPIVHKPPVFHPNEVNAMYMQMRNNGQNYVGQLASHPISIEEWRDRELERAKQHGIV